MISSRVNIESEEYYKKIAEHAESLPEEEVCGFIYLDRLLNPCVSREVNESQDKKNFFSISPSRILSLENIIGVYHSHPEGTAEPSKFDREMSEEMCMPFLVYSNKNKDFWLHYPDSYVAPKLTGRPFVRGFYQCYTLIKDYFQIELGDKESYSNHNYWPDFKGSSANKYLLGVLSKRYTRIKNKEIKKHDVLIFETSSPTVHAGMYKGDNLFYHHFAFQLSGLQEFNEKWQRRVKYVFRHNSLV